SLTNKPLQTHLHESTWSLPPLGTVSVTLDPVRISSLSDFGSLPVVAARVLAAEEGRDGVDEATLLYSSVLGGGGYLVRYGTRGKRPKVVSSSFTIVGDGGDGGGGILAVCQSMGKEGGDEGDVLGGIVKEFRLVGLPKQ
ncbi:hypothetical protein TrRE_jg13422, partial [Triparma retinervis]